MSNRSMTPLKLLHEPCGPYRLIARLDEGGMAEVNLAVPEGLLAQEHLVVLKRLSSRRSSSHRLRRMFLDEARLARRLCHPSVVRTLDTRLSGDEPFIVMEFLDGQPLARLLRRSCPQGLPLPAVLGIAADVCAGLHYAHQLINDEGVPLGIVHRDVSPQNIFITRAGQVKLVDFGIAKTNMRVTRTEAGTLKGKLAYMSPEQAKGDEVDLRSDVFSLGVVLYESLTLRRMWGKSATDVSILRRLLAGDIPSSPRAIDPEVPAEVDRICRRALAYDPEDRYPTARAMQEDLEAVLSSLGGRCSARVLGEIVQDLFWLERRTLMLALEDALASCAAPRDSEESRKPKDAQSASQRSSADTESARPRPEDTDSASSPKPADAAFAESETEISSPAVDGLDSLPVEEGFLMISVPVAEGLVAPPVAEGLAASLAEGGPGSEPAGEGLLMSVPVAEGSVAPPAVEGPVASLAEGGPGSVPVEEGLDASLAAGSAGAVPVVEGLDASLAAGSVPVEESLNASLAAEGLGSVPVEEGLSASLAAEGLGSVPVEEGLLALPVEEGLGPMPVAEGPFPADLAPPIDDDDTEATVVYRPDRSLLRNRAGRTAILVAALVLLAIPVKLAGSRGVEDAPTLGVMASTLRPDETPPRPQPLAALAPMAIRDNPQVSPDVSSSPDSPVRAEAPIGKSVAVVRANRSATRPPRNNPACSVSASLRERLSSCGALSERR